MNHTDDLESFSFQLVPIGQNLHDSQSSLEEESERASEVDQELARHHGKHSRMAEAHQMSLDSEDPPHMSSISGELSGSRDCSSNSPRSESIVDLEVQEQQQQK